MSDQFAQQDPTAQHAAPGSGDQTVEYPGRTDDMDVRPDHGEETYRGSGRLEGKKAVITGGDSGIGRAVAIAFAREGADVLLTHLDAEKDDADETARWVREAGRTAVTVAADLTEPRSCRDVVERAVRELGRIDVLVSNAAYQMSQDNGIDDITDEQFDRVMKTNVYAMFWLCKVLAVQGRRAAHAAGIHRDHHVVGAGLPTVAAPARLRDLEGGHRQLHQGAGGQPRRAGDPRQLGGARAGVDPADPGDDGREEAGVLRRAVADGACGPARGAGSHLRLPRLAGVELHDVRGTGRDRGIAHHVRTPVLRRLRRRVAEGRSDAPDSSIDLLGRVGLVGYGVVHLLIAWLAFQVVMGVPGVSADAQGAVGTLAQTPFGGVALGVGAAGLLAFALWQVCAAAIGFHWVSGGERLRKRVGAVAKAIAMVALAAVVLRYLMGRGGAAGNSSAVSVSADLLALPAGRALLGLAAVVVLVLAAAMTYTGVRRTFMGDLDVRRLAPSARRAIASVGALGHLARAAALAVVGVLVGSAAVVADPRRAGGLDAALRALGETGLGDTLLVVVALGFAAFGLYCLVDAATRRA